jgi:hypothetical protein
MEEGTTKLKLRSQEAQRGSHEEILEEGLKWTKT